MRSILERFFDPQETSPGDFLCVCPFHEDDRPSLSVNIEKGAFFCHACSEKGGIVKLLSKVSGYSEPIVSYELNFLKDFNLPTFDVKRFHEKLLNSDNMMDYLINKRLWTPKVIEDFKIGWDGNRVTIPIYNIFGDLVNVRAYKPEAKKEEPKVINLKGCGRARLFNINVFRSNTEKNVLLCEGEPDALAAISQSFPAVSSTAGAGHFNAVWAGFFRDYSTSIIYDCDTPGIRGSQKVAEILSSYTKSTRIIDLSSNLQSGKDITDYFLQGGTRESFKEIIEKTPYHISTGNKPLDSETFQVSLSESSQEKYYRKRVMIKVMVSGKMLSPYIIPCRVKVKCSMPKMKMCASCGIDFSGGERELKFDENVDETLQLIETQTDNHLKIFKKICGVPTRCQIVDYDVLEAQNIEEAKVIPHLDFSDDDSAYVLRQVYYLGHGLEPNTSYTLTGTTIPHPKTQQVTYLIVEAASLEDMVSEFQITEEVINQLRIFSVEQDREKT